MNFLPLRCTERESFRLWLFSTSSTLREETEFSITQPNSLARKERTSTSHFQGKEIVKLNVFRGFKPNEDFIGRFRFKPCAPMLYFIEYRMQRFDQDFFKACMKKYFYAQEALTRAGIFCPGFKTVDRAFWLFPIVVPNKLLFVQFMLEAGINAFRGAT